jgi:hypothetical protein
MLATRIVQLELVLWPAYPDHCFADLPQYASKMSWPARIWYRGRVWEFVQGSAPAGVLEYRERTNA